VLYGVESTPPYQETGSGEGAMTRTRDKTIAQGLQFSDAKNIGKIPTGSPPMGAPYRRRVGSNWRFSSNISLPVCHRNGARKGHIVAMEG